MRATRHKDRKKAIGPIHAQGEGEGEGEANVCSCESGINRSKQKRKKMEIKTFPFHYVSTSAYVLKNYEREPT